MQDPKLTGEHWQDNLIGENYTRKLCLAVNKKYLQELKLKRLELQLAALKRGEMRQCINEAAGVFVTDKNKKIIDVGFNDPEDLMLDNFGIFLANVIFSPFSWGSRGFIGSNPVWKNLSNGSSSNFVFYGLGSYSTYNGATTNTGGQGIQFHLGSGSTAAARNNYNVQTAFVASPENAAFSPVYASYGGGVANVGACITAGGSGTVNEVVLKAYLSQASMNNNYDTFAFCRDIISPGVAFTAGNIINVLYTFSF